MIKSAALAVLALALFPHDVSCHGLNRLHKEINVVVNINSRGLMHHNIPHYTPHWIRPEHENAQFNDVEDEFDDAEPEAGKPQLENKPTPPTTSSETPASKDIDLAGEIALQSTELKELELKLRETTDKAQQTELEEQIHTIKTKLETLRSQQKELGGGNNQQSGSSEPAHKPEPDFGIIKQMDELENKEERLEQELENSKDVKVQKHIKDEMNQVKQEFAPVEREVRRMRQSGAGRRAESMDNNNNHNNPEDISILQDRNNLFSGGNNPLERSFDGLLDLELRKHGLENRLENTYFPSTRRHIRSDLEDLEDRIALLEAEKDEFIVPSVPMRGLEDDPDNSEDYPIRRSYPSADRETEELHRELEEIEETHRHLQETIRRLKMRLGEHEARSS